MGDLHSINVEDERYVLKAGEGFTCLGFDYAITQASKVATWLGTPELITTIKATRGTVEGYDQYRTIMALGRNSAKVCAADLDPRYTPFLGQRVTVTFNDGETESFRVGKSTGWMPVYLAIEPGEDGGSPVPTNNVVKVEAWSPARTKVSALGLPSRKPRSRKDMIAYLADHFRYDTMNSWNAATSYANKIKVHAVKLVPGQDRDRLYEMLDIPHSLDDSGFNGILKDFDRRHNHSYQIGANGRSGGYSVLYQGGVKSDGYKRRCNACGQGNYRADATVCGRCGSTAMFPSTRVETFTYPGRSIDESTDFSAWDTSSLQDRVDLIWDFDQTCERAVQAFIKFALEFKADTAIVTHEEEVKVARPRKMVTA